MSRSGEALKVGIRSSSRGGRYHAREETMGPAVLYNLPVSYNATQEGSMAVTVSEKGWVVIPAELRKKYDLRPGTEVTVVDYGGVLALVPTMAKPVRQAAGMLKG